MEIEIVAASFKIISRLRIEEGIRPSFLERNFTERAFILQIVSSSYLKFLRLSTKEDTKIAENNEHDGSIPQWVQRVEEIEDEPLDRH